MTKRRHELHKCIHEVIARWNARTQIMHMGHKIDLAAELTEAIMAHERTKNAHDCHDLNGVDSAGEKTRTR